MTNTISWLLIFLMFLICISAFFTYANVKLKDDKVDWYFEILGPIFVLLTGNYLNKTGKKWRQIFIYSLLIFLVLLLLDS